jgi:type I restriction enzyme, S subunit
MATNQGFKSFVPHRDKLDAKFFYHWLRKNRSYLEGLGNGATFKEVSKTVVSRIEIPLPPLAEQRRIAEILDKADALRAKRRAALAQLDTLNQSIFLDMFGDPVGAGWRMTTVASIGAGAAAIRTGPFGSQLLHSEFVDDGVAVLGIDNAVENEFRWMQRRFITEAKYRKLSRYTVHPGDVLITLMGTCGRCAVVPTNVPLAINTKHLCCITVDRRKCLPEYLHSYFLIHPISQQYLRQTAKGAIMDGLNMGIIKEMPIPLAPVPLQKRYAQVVRNLSEVRTAGRRSGLEIDRLFASLQHRAFRGDL